ncbi:MAG: 5'/3'-nucleotidase SurE [Microbacteriaceae bacterium]
MLVPRLAALAPAAAVLPVALVGCAGSTGTTSTDTAATGTAAATASAPVRSILLTDDDGWDAEGIRTLYAVLGAAGYDVTVVAPLHNQSGASMSVSGGALSAGVDASDPALHWVDGTPADAARLGLTGILDSPPDLVVSGVNNGANVGYNVNYSGTVGAASVAAELGVPAIAVSADVGEAGADFAGASELVLELIRGLSAAAAAEMAAGTVVNLNVPVPAADGTAPDVVTAPQSTASWTTLDYVAGADGLWTPEQSPIAADTGDQALLAAGFATVTPLTLVRDDDSKDSDDEALEADLDAFAERY